MPELNSRTIRQVDEPGPGSRTRRHHGIHDATAASVRATEPCQHPAARRDNVAVNEASCNVHTYSPANIDRRLEIAFHSKRSTTKASGCPANLNSTLGGQPAIHPSTDTIAP